MIQAVHRHPKRVHQDQRFVPVRLFYKEAARS